MEKYKNKIPNILTLTRLILTPIIIIIGLLGYHKIVLALAIICALTDLFDGKLARKWNVITDFGAKLDTVADKVFAVGLTACFIRKYIILVIPLIIEIVIGLTNLYYYYKTKKTKSLMIGKIKTTLLFISIIVAMINALFGHFEIVMNGFIFSTINLQFLCLISYFLDYLNNDKLSVENNEMHKEIMNEKIDDEETKEITDLVELTKKYGLYKEDE